jgi:hypothetical protein
MLKMTFGLLASVVLAAAALAALADEAARPAGPAPLVLVDTAGKEQKLKGWKFTAGVTRLSWLAPTPAAAPKKDDGPAKAAPAAAGPEALVVVDEMKIFFLPPVTTFVPLDRVRSVSFDPKMKTMAVRVAAGAKPEDDLTLTCTTAYKVMNKLSLEAEVDRGDAGVAEVSYLGGSLRGNIKEIRFPAAKPPAGKAAPGRPAVVVTKDKTLIKEHKVSDLRPLYQLASGRQKLLPTLMFRKTLRLDVGKIKKLSADDEEGKDVKWQVTPKSGDESTYTLIESPTLEGGETKLLGLLGKIPAGYRRFPVKSISAVYFDAEAAPKEAPKAAKDKEKKCDE